MVSHSCSSLLPGHIFFLWKKRNPSLSAWEEVDGSWCQPFPSRLLIHNLLSKRPPCESDLESPFRDLATY